jgi:beta-lysine N6-acetyltransferase
MILMAIHNIYGTTVRTDNINNRLKIVDYEAISKNALKEIIMFAQKNDFGKIISTCLQKDSILFEDSGFINEGIIKSFYKGENAFWYSCFLKAERVLSKHKKREDSIIAMASDKKGTYRHRKTTLEIRDTTQEDIPMMTDIFKSVFETYPTPVHDEDYLERVMDNRIHFKAAFDNGKLVSIASADMDRKNLNAEITDCATYPQYRGRGLLSRLIKAIEDDLKNMGFYSVYSLSRAINPGINISLSKLGYDYMGRLINNCNICGGFEDMNIWCKKLNPTAAFSSNQDAYGCE